MTEQEAEVIARDILKKEVFALTGACLVIGNLKGKKRAAEAVVARIALELRRTTP